MPENSAPRRWGVDPPTPHEPSPRPRIAARWTPSVYVGRERANQAPEERQVYSPHLETRRPKPQRGGMVLRVSYHAAPLGLGRMMRMHGYYKHAAPLELGAAGCSRVDWFRWPG